MIIIIIIIVNHNYYRYYYIPESITESFSKFQRFSMPPAALRCPVREGRHSRGPVPDRGRPQRNICSIRGDKNSPYGSREDVSIGD